MSATAKRSAGPGPRTRLLIAGTLLSAWLILLLTGYVLGGATHLLLVGAVVAFPWRLPA